MPGTTTTADFKSDLATARAVYANAVTVLVNAIIDLEALTNVVNYTDPNAHAANTTFGGAKGY
ncbi:MULTISPECIES: hypothetical protein [unclassified Nitrobacter]|uniref:hypothetical protein n=1 Tax=unclassified Nitrobacter TaxID=2620411 RepID=UPI00092BF66B|nr:MULTISPECIES: hypothetical protein [unclassified Nitrobacter]MBN9147183.1 hypothetical protein [Nitrobacter sp.]OJV02319.1 MAG: hypothetical protein BGO16_01850 [Nitrobacter sp. 62-23]